MSELGEKVFNDANKWWIDATLQGNVMVTDLIKKTIELMDDAFSNQFGDKIDERVEEIAMQKAKDINGIPVRTLIAKDILNTLIEKTYLKTDMIYKDMADTAVRLTDALLKALKK